MNRCLWAMVVLSISLLYSGDVHKHPLVFEKAIIKLFLQEHFVYPLHNVKPVAYGIYSKNEDWRNVISNSRWSDINNFEYLIIKDYLKKNLSSNFLLLEEPNPYSEFAVNIYLINKNEFLNCCNENIETFKNSLGISFDPLVLIQNLELGKCTLLNSLKYSEQLFGILLGYGVHNSYEFSLNKNGNIKDIPLAVTDFNELPLLSTQSNYLIKLTPVLFVGIEGSNESLNLQKKYAEKYRELSQLYSGPNSYNQIIDKIKLR